MYSLFLIKRWMEDLLMYPFILLGRLIAWLKPLEKEYSIYFFFPFYSVGGAEKVHAQIAQAVGGNNCIIFFTRKSKNSLFLNEFKRSNCLLVDISKYTDNKWIYFANIIYRGIISAYINRQKGKPVIFNGQCNFGYKVSPWISRNINQIELIHSFNTFSVIRIPFLAFYTKTVMISHQTINDHQQQYRKLKIPAEYIERIQYIQNGINLPDEFGEKQENDKLVVLYVGRGTAEKRVHLIAEMAKKLYDQSEPIEVQFLGEVQDAIPKAMQVCCRFWGNQNDPKTIQNIYKAADVLILTSVFEGFPMVVMEAMANGLLIVSTAVGDLAYHIKENENGFLIYSKEEEKITSDGIQILTRLAHNRELVKKIGANNRISAFEHFGIEQFNKNYLRLFESLQ